jgi:hypothetical protein
MKVWFWSPQAPAMDLRHYDTIGHGLEMAYEDWKEGWDNPLGAANTSELTLWALAGVPSNAQLAGMAKTAAEPALLVATPEYYHANRAFGFWSLPDRSTPSRRALEDQLDSAFDFYNKEVDQRGASTTRCAISGNTTSAAGPGTTPSCCPITGCGTTSCARAGPTPSVWPRP